MTDEAAMTLPAWIAEAKRRAEAIDRGELELVDSEEMMARLRERARPKLPEGTVLDFVIDDEGDELDERELAVLNAAISRSLDQAARGEANPAEKILARLRERRR